MVLKPDGTIAEPFADGAERSRHGHRFFERQILSLSEKHSPRVGYHARPDLILFVVPAEECIDGYNELGAGEKEHLRGVVWE